MFFFRDVVGVGELNAIYFSFLSLRLLIHVVLHAGAKLSLSISPSLASSQALILSLLSIPNFLFSCTLFYFLFISIIFYFISLLPLGTLYKVTDADLAVLLETGDADGDGRISLEDFRGLTVGPGHRNGGDVNVLRGVCNHYGREKDIQIILVLCLFLFLFLFLLCMIFLLFAGSTILSP